MKVLAPLALGLVACGGADENPQTATTTQVSMFTGRMESADSAVGLAMSDEGHVYAYVCGGDTTFATHSRWFAGALAENVAGFENDGFRLDVTLKDATTDITLTTPDGTAHSTTATRAGPGSRAAVYESSPDSDCPWGVVVLDDTGGDPEVFGTWCGKVASTKVYAQVTPVYPIDFSKQILPVMVDTPDGEERFEVSRAGAIPAASTIP